MLNAIRKSKTLESDFLTLSGDLSELATRRLISTVTVIAASWLLALGLIQAGQISLELLPVLMTLMGTFCGSYLLITRRLLMAQLLWLSGFAATVTLALVIFERAEIAFLYALLPLMTVIMLGWQSAILFGSLAFALLWCLHAGWAGLVNSSYLAMTLFGELLVGFIGWAAISPLLTMLEWATFNYQTVRASLEEARTQRVELKQVQEDLVHANNELSRLTLRLKAMTQKAEEARRIKEEFVANVSHELRTPLNMIIGYTELIMKNPASYGKKLPAKLLADISAIQRNTHHLVDLVNDVLDLSQIEADRMALTRQWTIMQELIQAAVIAVQPLYLSKGLYLEMELPPEPLLAFCDSTRIREVVLNLLSNAGRFTETGGVIVRLWREQNRLVCSVSDSGPGISPEDQAKIFEPFQQLDKMLHHRSGGSGLGLAISKRFVELHDGQIWLTSQPGQGTTFYFSIPLDTSAEAAAPRSTPARWINPEQEFRQRTRAFKAPAPQVMPRLVVLEAEDAIGKLFRRYLDQADVVIARTVKEAAHIIEASPAQALVVNSASPVPSDEIEPGAVLPFDTPIVECWVPGIEEAARRLGVVQYLLKPVQPDQLLDILDSLPGENKRILIIDDDEEALQLFARLISFARPGWQLTRTTSGKQALRLMDEQQPDIALLDLILPDLDGFEVLRKKSASPRIAPIPVVVVTSTDPTGVPIVSNRLTFSRAGGLSVREFLNCILAVSEILTADLPKPGPAQPRTSPG
jgi:signal transduction histidine kinase/CheY-like chemotaxis protein